MKTRKWIVHKCLKMHLKNIPAFSFTWVILVSPPEYKSFTKFLYDSFSWLKRSNMKEYKTTKLKRGKKIFVVDGRLSETRLEKSNQMPKKSSSSCLLTNLYNRPLIFPYKRSKRVYQHDIVNNERQSKVVSLLGLCMVSQSEKEHKYAINCLPP